MSNSSRLSESCKAAGYEPGEDGIFDDWRVMEVVDDLSRRVHEAEKALETVKKCKKCRKQINRS